MTSDLQTKIWGFITAYKRATGKNLPYIALVRDEQKLIGFLHRTQTLQSPELRAAAEALLSSLRNRSGNNLEGADSTGSTALQPDQKQIERHYKRLVREMLTAGELAVSQRYELDVYCRRKRLTHHRSISLENEVRGHLQQPALDWSHEFLTSLRSFVRLHGVLTEKDRFVLFDTYIKQNRLSIAEAETLITRETRKSAISWRAVTDYRRHRKSWLAAGLLLVMTNAVAAIYLRNPASSDHNDPALLPYPREVRVLEPIVQDTTWKAETTYVLGDVIFVEGKARLTIEPGTRVLADFGSALVVTRDAELYARGTRNEPIVFTSAKGEGQRESGDWGGLVLLGNAPINQTTAHIEGIRQDDVRGAFGGQDAGSSCGVLEYIRIEFAGYEVFANNELNGLTLGGCGNGTIVRNLQVHRAADDGIEMFGGTADLRNILITGARDDSLDWDFGWHGRVQFLIAQQYHDAGDSAFEGDNSAEDIEAAPQSGPTMYNFTLIGGTGDAVHRGMTLRSGTAGQFHNFIAVNHNAAFVDIRDASTVANTTSGSLEFSHGLVFGMNRSELPFERETEGDDDDNGFSEEDYFRDRAEVQFAINPLLPVSATSVGTPTFVPEAGSPAQSLAAAIPQDEFWDQGANFAGAIRPGANSTWLDGWTAFPFN